MLTVRFSHVRSTKGAHVFEEVDENGKKIPMNSPDCQIGALYIRKTAMKKAPAEVLVTVSVEATDGSDPE